MRMLLRCSVFLLALLPIIGTGCTATNGTVTAYTDGKKIDQRMVYNVPKMGLLQLEPQQAQMICVSTSTFGFPVVQLSTTGQIMGALPDHVLYIGTGASLVFIEEPRK